MIPLEDYKKILSSVPILCVDIVIQNWEGKYLLVKRSNEPLKGEWWVIGGRVQKGETLQAAALRKLKEEAGIENLSLNMLGVYEDFFDKNSLQLDTLYHTVSVVFLAKAPITVAIKLDSQSYEWAFHERLPERLKIQQSYLNGETH